MNEKTIKVSDLFIHLFKMFNVTDVTEQMKQLSRKELFLLMILSVDSYGSDDPALLSNMSPFKEELKLIHKLQTLEPKQDSTTDIIDPILVELSKETGEKYININNLRTLNGEKLPEPTSTSDAISMRREISINNIVD
jgi:hypothetical protein